MVTIFLYRIIATQRLFRKQAHLSHSYTRGGRNSANVLTESVQLGAAIDFFTEDSEVYSISKHTVAITDVVVDGSLTLAKSNRVPSIPSHSPQLHSALRFPCSPLLPLPSETFGSCLLCALNAHILQKSNT